MISARLRPGLDSRLAEQLHSSAMERITSSQPFSCAWVGDKSTLVIPSTEGLDVSTVDSYLRELHSQALRYWREKGADNIGNNVAGFISGEEGSLPFRRLAIVGEDSLNWVLKVTRTPELPFKHRAVSQQIAVIGGEIVKASTVIARSKRPINSLEIQTLARSLRISRTAGILAERGDK